MLENSKVNNVPISVGVEFIQWAEQYWSLEERYDIPDIGQGETCQYKAVRKIFIDKINEIIISRLNYMTVK